MNIWKRAWWFAHDLYDGFAVAWSLARMYACERNDGHRWSKPQPDAVLGWSRTCWRCGCSETVPITTGTTATNSAGTYSVTWGNPA